MTVNNTVTYVSYVGNSATKAFAFNFRALEEEHIKVLLQDLTTGAFTTVLSTDYTVALEAASGTVIYPLSGDAIPSSKKIFIIRNTDFLQGISVENQQRYFPNVAERVWDKLTLLIQELYDGISRAVKVPYGETGLELVPGEDDQALIFSGGKIVGGPTTAEIAAAGTYAALVAELAEDLIGKIGGAGIELYVTDGVKTDFMPPMTVTTVSNLFVEFEGKRRYAQQGDWELVDDMVRISPALPAGILVAITALNPLDIGSAASGMVALTGGETLQEAINRNWTFPTRDELIAAKDWPWDDGAVVIAGPVAYRAEISATVFADLPGFTWHGDPTPDHFAKNTTPGTTNMTAAIDAVIAKAGEVHFLGDIYLTDGHVVDGATHGAVSFHGIPGKTKLVLSDEAEANILKFEAVTGPFVVEGIEFDGNKANQTTSDASTIGIYLNDSDYGTVSNCYVHDTAFDGIRIEGNAGTGKGEWCSVTGCTVENCGVDDTDRRAPGIRPFQANHFSIRGNICNDNTTDGIDVDSYSKNGTVSVNLCHNNKRNGIFIEEGSRRINVTSNEVSNSGDRDEAKGNGINVNQLDVTGEANAISDILIDGNTVYYSYQAGIRVSANAANTYVRDIIISNNSVIDSAAETSSHAGITLNANAIGSLDQVVIDGNSSTGSSKFAVWVGSDTVTNVKLGVNNWSENTEGEVDNEGGSTSIKFAAMSLLPPGFSGYLRDAPRVFDVSSASDAELELRAVGQDARIKFTRTTGAGYEIVNEIGVFKIKRGASGATDETQILNADDTEANWTLPLQMFGAGVKIGVASRAAAVTFATTYTASVPAGTILSDGAVNYVRTASATAITDMAGWLPFGQVYAEHFMSSTDAGLAINRAVNYLASGGTVNLIGGKVYTVSTKIVLKNDVTIQGVGGQAILRLADSANVRMLETYDFAAQKAGSSTDVTYGIGLRNILFSGNSDNNASGEGVFLSESGGYFENIQIDDFAGTGFERQGTRDVDFADDGSGNFPISPYVRRVETIIPNISVWRCGNATDPAVLLEGPGDLRGGEWFFGDNDGQIILNCVSADVGYLHSYSNGAAVADDYSTKITAQMSIGQLEIRDNDYGGCLVSSDEVQIGKLYASKNGRKATAAGVYQFHIDGSGCEIGGGLISAKDQAGAEYDGDGVMPLLAVDGSQNNITCRLTGNLSSTRTATGGCHMIAGDMNTFDLTIYGIDGPGIEFDAGTYNIIKANIADCDTALQKDANNTGGTWQITANNVSANISGSAPSPNGTENMTFIVSGNDLCKVRIISDDIAVDATGTGQLTIAHGLIGQPRYEDISVSYVRGTGAYPGDCELDPPVVASRDATNIYVRWRVRTASGTAGAKVKVAVAAQLGVY